MKKKKREELKKFNKEIQKLYSNQFKKVKKKLRKRKLQNRMINNLKPNSRM